MGLEALQWEPGVRGGQSGRFVLGTGRRRKTPGVETDEIPFTNRFSSPPLLPVAGTWHRSVPRFVSRKCQEVIVHCPPGPRRRASI